MTGDERNLPMVSVVVPTHRRHQALRETLSALVDVQYPTTRYEIVVVGDGPGSLPADIEDGVAAQGVAFTALEQPHAGAATARNRGASQSGGELIVFCDDDILVAPDNLRLHAEHYRRDHERLVNGVWDFSTRSLQDLESTPFGRYRVAIERGFQQHAGEASRVLEPGLDSGSVLASALTACNLGVARSTFDGLGGFDEAFPFAGQEDRDLSLRARQAGCSLVVDPSIRLLHNETHLSRRRYCLREERAAHTRAVLALKHPDIEGSHDLLRRVGLADDDPSSARASRRETVVALATARPVISAAHTLAATLERVSVPDGAMARIYDRLVALHVLRGARAELKRGAASRTGHDRD